VRVVCGVDWGWTNPGVLLVVGLTTDDHTWVLAECYATERSIEWWAEEGARLRKEHRVDAFVADPSEPANIAALQRAGLPIQPANNAVVPGIAAVSARIDTGREHVVSSCEHTIAEYGMYSWKQRSDGTIRPDEPDKVADHCMDARRYAEMALRRQRTAQSLPVKVEIRR